MLVYLFQSDRGIRALNRKYRASPDFDDANAPLNLEAVLLDQVANNWVAVPAHVTQLNEIDRNWPASASPSGWRDRQYDLQEGHTG